MTTFDYLQGDPALFLGRNGSNIIFKGGQPVTDQGIHNAIFISLFTKPGWWGNILTKEESKKIGSDFTEVSSRPIVDLTSINDIKQSADRALKWMSDVGLAESEVTVINPNAQTVQVDIKIKPPGKDVEELRVSFNGLNWQAQAKFPAEGRE